MLNPHHPATDNRFQGLAPAGCQPNARELLAWLGFVSQRLSFVSFTGSSAVTAAAGNGPSSNIGNTGV
ncbi:hypothetical protein VTI28DRAFT_8856 [Corynascus sepedonium]